MPAGANSGPPRQLAPSFALPTDRAVVTMAELAGQADDGQAGRQLAATHCRGSASALLLRQLALRTGRPLIVVTPDQDGARQLADDLGFALGTEEPIPDSRRLDEPTRAELASALPQQTAEPCPSMVLLPTSETSPYAHVAPDRAAAHQRIAALLGLALGQGPQVLVVTAPALTRKVLGAEELLAHTEELHLGLELDREQLVDRLIRAGYVRAPLVEDPGTLAVRGSLLDVWPPGAPLPVRVELDGDQVVQMKRFDAEDQRSQAVVETLWLPPARESVLSADKLARAQQRLRQQCDAVNWPSSRTRALIEELSQGRLVFGAEGFLPAFSDLAPLLDQLPADAITVLDDPAGIATAIDEQLERAQADEAEQSDQPHFALEAFHVTATAVADWLTAHTTVALTRSPISGEGADAVGSGEADVAAGPSPLERWATVEPSTPSLATWDQADLERAVASARAAQGYRGSLDPLLHRIAAWQAAGLRVVITTRTHSQAERVELMLRNRGLTVRAPGGDFDAAEALAHPARSVAPADPSAEAAWVVVGTLARGAVAPTEGLVLITETEVFGARKRRRTRTSQAQARAARRSLLADLRGLSVGDHVVHLEHGIGRYHGLRHQQIAGHLVDLLEIEYAGGDKLFLPVYRLNQLQKFRGSEADPKLDRLGGQTFARSKARAAKQVRQLAEQLLRLYAERRAVDGVATPAMDDEYRAFEAAFPYEETDDQARAIAEVAADLESDRPMDRLVCGDVGFGKTEIALRAAWRVAMSGRQVALLCPTTVLSQQHLWTFESRLGGYPLEIGALSRFQSKREQDRVVRGLRDGTIDIVVGTHRLLSKDVHFKQLGLLVVDEEQRFGVTAKERIKALRTNVDALTLTATPIPRTLQMAVSGLRDLSLISTPPADRRAIRTVVTRNDPKVLREAIHRELDRGGQVFFVHNRVASLESRAADIQLLVPDARIAVAHGQQPERALERTMLDFVQGRYDVLCCTAIIENGLDIPRCNTIIVDRTELFGLAQLYQLRGRVGRAKERAYCYLVVPPEPRFGDDARARVEALSRHTELGAGFQVAALDLDLRGAGDLLGAEQSGTVHSVGFEMFCHMLDEAVHELRGEPVVHEVEPELSFDTEALLPEQYVADVGVRLSLYKRLASASGTGEIEVLAQEMEDRFGPPPIEARRLVQLMALKTELRRLRVLACEASSRRVTLHLRDDTPLDPGRLAQLLQQREGPYRLSPDMRLTRMSQPEEAFASGLEAADHLLGELARQLARSEPG